jgi:Zn-dependent protease with chaperone function
MDFFSHQDRAKGHSRLLLALFSLAVLGTVFSVYLTFTLAYGFYTHESRRAGDVDFRQKMQTGWTLGASPPYRNYRGMPSWWDPTVFSGVTGITLLLIATGAALQAGNFTAGGSAVAALLGGRPIAPGTQDPQEQRLINVVEEMAIASGMPAPATFVLSEDTSINAFAAGHQPGTAVIGVTRGTLEQLTRDELQGVVAHEFSHILNGDMRLNMRLSILSHGILFLAATGQTLIRAIARVPLRGGKNNGGHIFVILILLASGLALMAIGSIGHAFAWLLQAAISRQREFLADAAAVQFTRNPSGIAGALARIATNTTRSRRLHSPHAGELGHFLFSKGSHTFFEGWTSTHPPLEERIHRIIPGFLDHWTPPAETVRAAEKPARSSAPPPPPLPLPGLPPLLQEITRVPLTPALLGSTLTPGAPTAPPLLRPRHEHLAYAQRLLHNLHPALVASAHDPYAARALVLAVLRASQDPPLPTELAASDPGLHEETLRFLPACQALDPRVRLPLVDLAIPALRTLTPAQYLDFRQILHLWIQVDGQITLFEFALLQCLKTHLDPAFPSLHSPSTTVPPLHNLALVTHEIRIMLGALAYTQQSPEMTLKAFAYGLDFIDFNITDKSIPPAEQCDLIHVETALKRLALLTPGLRRNVLYASAQTVALDGTLGIEESELIRALGDALNCPLPPFLHELA